MKKTIQNDLTQKYSKATIATHWLTALLILILFPLGKYMERIEPSGKMGLITIHAVLGIIVFVLTIVYGNNFHIIVGMCSKAHIWCNSIVI